MKNYGIIYTCTNLINGKVYVGQTTRSLDKRMYEHLQNKHKGRTTKFYRALTKYDESVFKWEQIDFATSKEDLCTKEIFYIRKFNSFAKGYNMTKGGEAFHSYGKQKPIICLETLKVYPSISKAKADFPVGCFDSLLKGKIFTVGGYHWDYYIEGNDYKNNGYFGKPPVKRHTKIICLETGKIYDRIRDAELDTGIHQSHISCVLKGKQKLAGGYHWAVYSPYIKNKYLNKNKVVHNTKKKIVCLETNEIFNCAEDVSEGYGLAVKTVLNYIRAKEKLKRLNLQFAFLEE